MENSVKLREMVGNGGKWRGRNPWLSHAQLSATTVYFDISHLWKLAVFVLYLSSLGNISFYISHLWGRAGATRGRVPLPDALPRRRARRPAALRFRVLGLRLEA